MDNVPGDEFIIRRATVIDVEQIINGIDEICKEGGAFYTTSFIPTPQWEAVFYFPETVLDHFLAVVEWNGRIIGAGRIFPGGKKTLMNHVADLGLYIQKPFRQKGVGSQLLQRLIDQARISGIEKITLSVFLINSQAFRLFEKHGFTQSGCLRNQIKIKDHYVDLLLMEKFLCQS